MYLLDTNIVSELRKVTSGKAHPNVSAWASQASLTTLFLSSITILELETGVLLMERRDATQGSLLRQWLTDRVLPAFHDRILYVDTEVALICAKLQIPSARPYADSLIAATALVHRLTIVARNAKDFATTGVPVFDPWQAQT